MMNKKLLTTTGLLIAVALFLAANIVSNAAFKSVRLDLTEGQLYTLSTGSKNILNNLEEPITLRFYLSQKLANDLPGINSYATRVRELLEEYQRLAGHQLKLMILDPEPFSEEEDRAVSLGLQGVPVDENNNTFYFGLAGTNSTNGEEVIAFFQPNREEFLEYDITKLIYQLAYPEQKVVGIMSGLPIQGDSSAPFAQANPSWMVVEQIRQLFQVQTVELDAKEIPKEINILMIVHPKKLSDTTLYAIDQFVLKGGRAIVFVDPYAETDEPPTDPNNPLGSVNFPRNSHLNTLFEAWGIELAAGKVVGDLKTAQKVQVKKQSRVDIIKYPVWFDLNDNEYFNVEDITTNNLGNIALGSAGILTKKADAETQFIPLLQTSEQAMPIDTNRLGMLSDPEELSRDFKSEGKRFTIAARITGKVKTAFPSGKPQVEENKEEAKQPEEKSEPVAEHLTESKEPVNLIVVADTDVLDDKFWVQVQNFFGQRIAIPRAANATFVTNALDNLSGSNDLISVRNRGSFSRPFTRLEAIQQEAEQQFRMKEKELLTRLQETDQKINELQSKKEDANKLVLNAEQQQEVVRFREEKIKIRKELRGVQHELRKNIERLEARMKFINIGLMPLLIGIGGITLSFYRNRRKRGLQLAKS